MYKKKSLWQRLLVRTVARDAEFEVLHSSTSSDRPLVETVIFRINFPCLKEHRNLFNLSH